MEKTMKGGVARTASGTTSFEYRPGKAGGTVVFIHGFAIPSTIWEKNFYDISERGYAVLRFDRFGLGGSQAADQRAAQTIDLFVAQLKELLDEIRPPSPITLVGLSFGAAVAAAFLRSYPGFAERVCFIAPAVHEAISAASRLIFIPGLGPLLFKAVGKKMLGPNLRKTLPAAREATFIDGCLRQLKGPGYLRALGSTVRHSLLRKGSISYEGIAPGPPVNLIWGTADSVIPFKHAEGVRRSLMGCEFHPIPGAGHCLPLERADEVNRIIEEFLRASPGDTER